jgi:hypothetical protein
MTLASYGLLRVTFAPSASRSLQFIRQVDRFGLCEAPPQAHMDVTVGQVINQRILGRCHRSHFHDLSARFQ